MTYLPESPATLYAKTALGQHEMQTRSLGLKPAQRRLLVLVDGKRSGRELALLLAGQDIEAILGDLLDQGCIEPVATLAVGSAPGMSKASTVAADQEEERELTGLPAARLRNAKQVEMARNFMINTVNLMFGQNMRLSLIEAISNCHDAEQLRSVYPLWLSSMRGNRSAVKRLPELQRKLFEVL